MARRGRNEGSIYERTDGRWAGAIDLGFVDGRRVRKTFYGPTRKAVRKKLNRALGKHEQGGIVDTDDTISVGRHLENWMASVSVRPKTRRQYEQVVRLYLKPALGPVRLNRLEPDQVRAMVRGLEQRGLSARTATLARDILRIALSQAVSDELIARNVAELVRRPKAGRRLGPVLSVDQGSAFLASLSGHRLEAVVTCGLTLGLRLGEVLGLQWSDVDLRARQLKIRHALQTLGKRRELVDLKSEESHRELALPTVVVRAIERHRVGQAERRLAAGSQWKKSDFVFTTRSGRPLDGTLVTRDLKRLLARTWMGGESDCDHERERDHVCLDCGATRLPIVSFHALRHSCASLLLAEGVPTREVSDLLGHSDVALTLRTYTHIIKAQRQRTAGVIDRMFDSQTDSQTVGQGQK